jgi:preprotein translocase subunit SecD
MIDMDETKDLFFGDWKRTLITALFIIFLGALLFAPSFRGITLMCAFISFGILSNIGKESKGKLMSLAFLIILSLINITLYGVNFGIEFSGGIRIPVILKKPVDANTMEQVVATLKKRASLMGLTQVRVTAVGPSEVDLELANTSDPTLVKQIKKVITKQGRFIAVVDGKIALSGEHILPGTVVKQFPPYLPNGEDWGVSFSIDEAGAKQFAEVAKGKAHYPVYMFLDRPTHADVFLTKRELVGNNKIVSFEKIKQAAEDALRLEDDPIHLYIVDDANLTKLNGTGRVAILTKETEEKIGDVLKKAGYNLSIVENITPQISSSETSVGVDKWKAIGLLSSPHLSPAITKGIPSYRYMISGRASGIGREKYENAMQEAMQIETILKSGSLPVEISVGSAITIPSPLGSEFLKLSLLGIAITIIAIAVFVALRYQHPKFVLPIFAISISELIILMALLGSFTIDLAGMAGIIAALGVGVDAQIVITDELLKKTKKEHEEALRKAFDIITINVIIAVITMLPLLFSGIVEVINFSLSTILGALLGLLISRPSYAAIVEYFL